MVEILYGCHARFEKMRMIYELDKDLTVRIMWYQYGILFVGYQILLFYIRTIQNWMNRLIIWFGFFLFLPLELQGRF